MMHSLQDFYFPPYDLEKHATYIYIRKQTSIKQQSIAYTVFGVRSNWQESHG